VREEYNQIIIESWKNCQEKKGLEIITWHKYAGQRLSRILKRNFLYTWMKERLKKPFLFLVLHKKPEVNQTPGKLSTSKQKKLKLLF